MKKVIALLLLFATVFSVFTGCTVEKKAHAFQCGTVYGSVVSEYYKITKTQPLPVTPEKELYFRVFRNDFDALQFYLTDDTKPVKNLSVSVSPLKAESGKVLDEGALTVSKEYFHPLRTLEGTPCYPDALLPLNSFTNNSTVEKGENGGYFIEVDVPFSAAAEVYRGQIDFSFEGGKIEVPVKIEVLPFDVPYATTLEASGGIFSKFEYLYDRTPEEIEVLNSQLRELLKNNRMNPTELPLIRWDFDDPVVYADYIADMIESDPRCTKVSFRYKNHEDMAIIFNRLEERGVKDKCYVSDVDEPTKDNLPKVIEYLDKLMTDVPNANNLICMNSFYPELVGKLNHWCVTPNISQRPEWNRMIKDSGAVLWQYGGYADGGALGACQGLLTVGEYARVQKFDIRGMVHWSVYHSGIYDSIKQVYTSWSRNLWTDPYCFRPEEICEPLGNGATFFYPGMEGDGIVNEDVVCESMRGKYIRDSVEFHDLLKIREQQLKEAIKAQGLEGLVSSKDLMAHYYDNTVNAVQNEVASFDAKPLSAYEHVKNALYDDILNHTNTKPLFSVKGYEETENFNRRDLFICLEKGKTVQINGKTAQEAPLTEKMSKYVLSDVCFGYEQVFSFLFDGKEIREKIYSRSSEDGLKVSVFDGEITDKAYEAVMKMSNKGVVQGFENGEILMDLTEGGAVVRFSYVGSSKPTDYEKATHIAVTLTNRTPNFLLGLRLFLITKKASLEVKVKTVIDPGKTTTVYFPLDFLSEQYNLKPSAVTGVRLLNDAVNTDKTVKIAVKDISFVTVN